MGTTVTTFFADALRRAPVMAILRGMAPDDAVAAASVAWDAGVGLVEVTIETEDALPALAAVVRAAPQGIPVGAGTVTTPDRLAAAVEAGASFGVAPGLDADTVLAARERDIPFLPGVATPTEVGQALRLGISTVKVFPAATLGPAWLRAMAGPFPGLGMVATGGVTAATAPEYLEAGALAVGVGGSVTPGGRLAAVLEAVLGR